MLESLFSGRSRHPLCELREAAHVTQIEISKLTGYPCSKISLVENGMATYSPEEERKVKAAIREITRERQKLVLSEARR